MRARVLLLRGYLDKAAAEAHLCLADAEVSGSRLALCYAIRNGVCPIDLARGDFDGAMRAADRLGTLAEEYGLTFWLDWCSCLRGQIQVARGEHAVGVAPLLAGLARRQQNGWRMRNPEFQTSLAQGLAQLGRIGEAMDLLTAAASECEGNDQRWCLPEVRRCMAEVLMLDPTRGADAWQLLVRAASEARAGGALLFELRSTLSLHRLGQTLGRAETTRRDLLDVLDRFSEGHDTPQLAAARETLSRGA